MAVDLRGHGDSPRFTEPELGRAPRVWLDDLLEVLVEFPSPPVAVGHSLGALLVLRAAATRPELVRGIVLEDPARPAGNWRPDPKLVREQELFLDGFARGTAAEKARMRVDTRWTHAEIDAWADCKPQVDRRMIREGLYLGSDDWAELFTRVAVPTLLVLPFDGGTSSAAIDLGNPLVEERAVPGVGHCVRRDDPGTYHAVVDPFLERVSPVR